MFFSKRDYKVKVTGRAGLIYKEGKKSMKVDSEMLTGSNYDIVVYKGSISKWDPPFEEDSVGKDEQNRILENIKSDLKEHGYKVDVD